MLLFRTALQAVVAHIVSPIGWAFRIDQSQPDNRRRSRSKPCVPALGYNRPLAVKDSAMPALVARIRIVLKDLLEEPLGEGDHRFLQRLRSPSPPQRTKRKLSPPCWSRSRSR